MQGNRKGCRIRHPKLAAWKFPPLSPELCVHVPFAERLSCGNHGALMWLFAGAKEFSGIGFWGKPYLQDLGLIGLSHPAGK